jgi:hypothetical protein
MMCDWVQEFGIDPGSTRASEIIGKTTVMKWAIEMSSLLFL